MGRAAEVGRPERGRIGGGGLREWAGLLQGVHGLLAQLTLLVVVALDGGEDEHERERAEDERLDEGQHDLEAVQRDRDEGDGEAGDDAQGDLAAVDVAEESHRQRDRLDELEDQLDETHEQRDEAGADALLELVEREELARVAADAEPPEALDVEREEGDEREADGHVDVAGGRPQSVRQADDGDEAAPVERQDEDEERREQGHVAGRARPAHADAEALSDS